MGKLQNWATPQYVFDFFNRRYNYDLDLCAEPWSAKCKDFCSLPDRDAFDENLRGRRVWCNPPYDNIEPWVELAQSREAQVFTLLVPARTDRPWFENCLSTALVQFIKGRIKFLPPPGWEGQINPKTGKPNKATSCEFPVMAITYADYSKSGHYVETLCIEIPRPARKAA